MITMEQQVGLTKDETLGKPLRDILERHQGKRAGGLIAMLEEIQGPTATFPRTPFARSRRRPGSARRHLRGGHLLPGVQPEAARQAPRLRAAWARRATCGAPRRSPRSSSGSSQVPAGETTPDREFTLETRELPGGLRPRARWSSWTATTSRTSRHASRQGDPRKTPRGPRQGRRSRPTSAIFPVEVSCARCNHSLMDRAPDRRPPVDPGDDLLRRASTAGSASPGSTAATRSSRSTRSPIDDRGQLLLSALPRRAHRAAQLRRVRRADGADDRARGRVVQICSRRGCKGHMLDLAGHALA